VSDVAPAASAPSLPCSDSAAPTAASRPKRVVADRTRRRAAGFLGELAVNVLQLNLDLDRRYPARSGRSHEPG